ncbi:MAG: hypothetical protein WAV52_09305 [Luteococcus japonicus]
MHTALACIFNWTLILQYLQVLCWPGIALVALIFFKGPIAAKIGDMKSASLAGFDADFATETKALGETVERLQDQEEQAGSDDHRATVSPTPHEEADHRQPQPKGQSSSPSASPEPSAHDHRPEGPAVSREDRHEPDWTRSLTPAAARRLDRSLIDLMTDPDFEEARRIVPVSTPAAILTAHREMERCLRAAWAIDNPDETRWQASSTQMVRDLGLDSEFGSVIRDLTRLRNNYAHGDAANRIDVDSAMSYIDTCEAVAQSAQRKVLSKLRHPSGAHPFLAYLTGGMPLK